MLTIACNKKAHNKNNRILDFREQQEKSIWGEFPGSPMVRTLRCHC